MLAILGCAIILSGDYIMPYCPKCDMEFVEGITACTDCGGPLYESEEAYKMKKKEEDTKRRAQCHFGWQSRLCPGTFQKVLRPSRRLCGRGPAL